jgi:sterol carrier protein 2
MNKRRVFVVGNGMTKFLKPREGNPDYPIMAKQAINRALKDAGVTFDQVEQATVGYVYGDSTCGQRAVYEVGMTGIPIYNVNNNCSTGSTALYMGHNLIQGGQANCVLVVGFEKMEAGSLQMKYPDRTSPLDKHMIEMGNMRGFAKAPFAPQIFGNAGLEHQEKYGTKDEHFGKVAYKNHLHSVNNPYSQFRDKYTLDQVMKSPKIFGPLTKLQCCPTSDGAGAAVLVSEEFMKKHKLEDQAVEILGMTLTTDYTSTYKSCMNIAGFDMAKQAAKDLYKKTGVTPNEVQVIEVHDCFSANELITYEALGLCPEGKAGEFIDKGDNTYGGKYVINPSGGLISKGHPLGATGLAQCAELCWQLRGMADKRQVSGAKIALQHNLGLGGACVLALYKKNNTASGHPRPDQTSDPDKLEALEQGKCPNSGASTTESAKCPNSGDKCPNEGKAQSKSTSAPLKSEKIFASMGDLLKANGKNICAKVNAIFNFEVLRTADDKNPTSYIIDMKNSPGSIKEGKHEKPDATFTMTDDNILLMYEGKLTPQTAFLQQKMKIKGNMAAAMKFTPDLLAKPKL